MVRHKPFGKSAERDPFAAEGDAFFKRDRLMMLHISASFWERRVITNKPVLISLPCVSEEMMRLLSNLCPVHRVQGARGSRGLAGGAMEDAGMVDGRGVQMKRHRVGGGSVGHAVQPQPVVHVSDLVFPKGCGVVGAEGSGCIRPREHRLLKFAVENLHDAMGACVVVDGRSVSRTPGQHQQAEITVARVHQVAGVRAGIEMGVFEPVLRARRVAFHQSHDPTGVDLIGIKPKAA